jgi:hypothetical protein
MRMSDRCVKLRSGTRKSQGCVGIIIDYYLQSKGAVPTNSHVGVSSAITVMHLRKCRVRKGKKKSLPMHQGIQSPLALPNP